MARQKSKSIRLSNGKRVWFNLSDWPRIQKSKWYPFTSSKGRTYATTAGRGHGLMHRFILGLTVGDGRVVDHKDGNGLNNRRSNLRVTTLSLNLANQKPTGRGTSRYKGVSFKTDKGKWRAVLATRPKQVHIGYFRTQKEAALAYNRAAKKAWGSFALLNRV